MAELDTARVKTKEETFIFIPSPRSKLREKGDSPVGWSSMLPALPFLVFFCPLIPIATQAATKTRSRGAARKAPKNARPRLINKRRSHTWKIVPSFSCVWVWFATLRIMGLEFFSSDICQTLLETPHSHSSSAVHAQYPAALIFQSAFGSPH